MSTDSRLTGVHPHLISAVYKILDIMHAAGHPMIVTDGVRTEAQQRALYAKGRTAPGAIVTHADGVDKKSNHQPDDDGYGHAVDCCFLVEGHASWDESNPWKLYGVVAQTLGLNWGGAWTGFVDRPHIELP